MKKFTVKGIAKLEITTIIEAESEEEALEKAEDEIFLTCSPLAFETYYGLSKEAGELDYDGDIEWSIVDN